MQSYLQQLAKVFAQEVGTDLSQYTFVFPNHRAGLFFRKYLAQSLTQSIFAPQILTINECFASLSDLTVTDQLTLLLRLYRLYIQQRNDHESLEQFLHWGKMMLADFSEVDNHLVQEVQSLYSLVEDMHDIDMHFASLSEQQLEAIKRFWGEYHRSVAMNKDSQINSIFVSTWKLLYPLYKALQTDLLQDKLAYEGLLHRHVIEHWEEIPEDKFRQQYIFIGFNAMTESERQLMLRLQAMGRADFYFDYQDEFLRDENNAASRFMQDNQLLFRSRYTIDLPPCQDAKQFTLISVTSSISQAHQVHEVLSKQIDQTTDWTRTAVVLPNEELLIPLIHTIPSEIPTINVTMGYPLRATSAYMLVAYPEQYITPMPATCQEYIQRTHEQLNLLRNSENSESIYLMLKTLERIAHAITTFKDIPFTIHAVQQLHKMLTMEMTIPYTGEPLEGLQIMGVLETRALDFDNIIITDFNDEIYPGRARGNSFIPYTLRRGFGLPTVERQDAIFAYNFYRMIAHAKNIWFIANTHADDQHSGELSRYYYQLLWQYHLPIHHITINDQLQTTITAKESIIKTPSVMQHLSKFYSSSPAKGHLSPSAIGDYLRCPKSFYYKHIEGIREPEQDESITISDTTLGNVLHSIMEQLYTPFEGKMVEKTDVEAMMQRINDDSYWQSQEVLSRLMGDELSEKVIRSCVANALTYDYEQAPFEYIQSEQKVDKNLHVPTLGQDIAIRGKIDRIDILNNRLRVIDYKTGKVDLEYTSMGKVFGLDFKGKDQEDAPLRKEGNKYILQTLLYCWLLDHHAITLREQSKHAHELELAPYLYPVRQLHDTTTLTYLHNKSDKTQIMYTRGIPQEFVDELTRLMEEIFNPDIPFSPTDKSDNCEDCYLAQICALRGEK